MHDASLLKFMSRKQKCSSTERERGFSANTFPAKVERPTSIKEAPKASSLCTWEKMSKQRDPKSPVAKLLHDASHVSVDVLSNRTRVTEIFGEHGSLYSLSNGAWAKLGIGDVSLTFNPHNPRELILKLAVHKGDTVHIFQIKPKLKEKGPLSWVLKGLVCVPCTL